MEFERLEPLSLKSDKQIYANRQEGRAISVLHLPDRWSLDEMLAQRERLQADAGNCSLLNLPRNPVVRIQDDAFLLIEEMKLCSDEGPEDQWIEDMLESMLQLHGAGWVHLDFKPEHLLCDGGHWQLHDFDGAMPIGTKFRERDITWAYAPPDVLWHTVAQPDDDLYAAALMLYRRHNHGKLPFEQNSENRAAVRRYISPVIPVPDAWGSVAKRFFRKALSWNRRGRFHSTEAFIEAYKHVELTWKAGE